MEGGVLYEFPASGESRSLIAMSDTPRSQFSNTVSVEALRPEEFHQNTLEPMGEEILDDPNIEAKTKPKNKLDNTPEKRLSVVSRVKQKNWPKELSDLPGRPRRFWERLQELD